MRAKRMKLIGMALLLTVLAAGCRTAGDGSGQQTDAGQQSDVIYQSEELAQADLQEFYYDITEEIVLPDPGKSLTPPEGGKIVVFAPFLAGSRVVCNACAYDDRSQFADFYILALEPGAQEWTGISVVDCAFEMDGVSYDSLDSSVYGSMGGEAYVTARRADGTGSSLCVLGETGPERIVCDIPEAFAEEKDDHAGEDTFTRDREGNFYAFFGWSGEIGVYDGELQKVETIGTPGRVYGMAQGAAGADVYWYGSGADGKAAAGCVTDRTLLFDGFDGTGSDYRAAISPEGAFLMADTQKVWRVTDGAPREVFSFAADGYTISELYGMTAGEQEEMLLLVKMDGETMLLVMEETDRPSEKQEIVIAYAMQHPAMDRTIARFNRLSDAYHISVMLPGEDEAEEEFRSRVLMELGTGGGPDILGHDLVADQETLVENGYLECVDDVFEDPALYLEAALEGCRIDGRLYGVPYDCQFDAVFYAGEDAGERTSWTLPELMSAVRASDAGILEEGISGVELVRRYALFDDSCTAYIDWEQGESHLTEQPFLDLLAFAKDYCDNGLGGEAFAFSPSLPFDSLRLLKQAAAYFDGDAVLLGYPRAEGNGFYVTSRQLYLNAASGCKEGAKEFLRFLVSEEEQRRYVTFDIAGQMREEGISSLSGYNIQFPVSLNAYDTLVELELEKDAESILYTDTGTILTDALYTEEMVEQFYDMLAHALPAHYKASAISDMIYEELSPYFAGEITAGEAADKLDNRVQLYLDERNY